MIMSKASQKFLTFLFLILEQNFCHKMKSIAGKRKYDQVTPLFKELNYLNLQERRKVHEAVFTLLIAPFFKMASIFKTMVFRPELRNFCTKRTRTRWNTYLTTIMFYSLKLACSSICSHLINVNIGMCLL